MSYKSGPRQQGRYRTHHRPQVDRLYSLPEMADMLDLAADVLWRRVRAGDPGVPPAFQPRGPGTAWKFAERSYLQWLATFGNETREASDG